MGVVVMAVIAAVIVGRVMRDGTLVTGSVVRVSGMGHRRLGPPTGILAGTPARRAPLDSRL